MLCPMSLLRLRTSSAVLLTLATLSLPIAAQTPTVFPPPLIQGGATVQLGRHTWVIPDQEVTLVPNVGIVVGRTATLVIDTGMGSRNARTILAEVARISRNARLIVVVTHTHPEHISGLAAFPAGTVFIAAKAQHPEIAGLMERGFGGMARLSPFIGELLQDAGVRQPDRQFDRVQTLDLGGVRVRLEWLGPSAHSPGDTIAVVEGDGVIFAGDLAPKDRFPSFSPSSTRAGYLAAFSRLEALKPRVMVPSHGPTSTLAVLSEQRTMLEAMRSRVQALKTAGTTLEATTRTITTEFTGRYPAWRNTVPNEIAPIVTALYAE